MSAGSSYPALLLYTSKSKMEGFEESNVNNNNLLEIPNSPDYTDEEDVKATLKPRFSPLPRRRSSVCSDDGDLEPPPTVARKVSFADAFGFDLVSVKEFDSSDVPTVSPNFVTEITKIEEFYLTSSFILPPISSIERLHAKKVILESVDFIPGTTSMKGVVRVLNLSYEKQVLVRMSLDDWHSHFDQLAEYVPDSCTGDTDLFCFTISLVSPYVMEGARLEFCICYETAVGTFWDNNDGQNYVLTCRKRERFVEVSKSTEDVTDKNKKSCLKPALSKEEEETDVLEAEKDEAKEKYIPRIICSHDEFTEDTHNEGKADKVAEDNKEDNNEEESNLELFLSQRLMKAKITSSEEKYSFETSATSTIQNRQQDTEIKYPEDDNSRTPDHFSRKLQFNDGDENPSVLELNQKLPPGDLSSAPHISQHSREQEPLSPVYAYDTEETALHPAEINRDSIGDNHLEASETPPLPQGNPVDDILDHNANPSAGQNTVLIEYFSTDNTEGGENEINQNKKSETESKQYASDFSHYDDILWKGTATLSTNDGHHVLSSHCEPSNSVVLEKGQEEIHQTASNHVSSTETSQNIDVDDINKASDEKQPSDFQSTPSPAARIDSVTVDYSSINNDPDKNDSTHDNRSVGLTHEEDQYNIKYHPCEDKKEVTQQIDRLISDVTEAEVSCHGGSLPGRPPITCTVAENKTSAKLHVSNESLGSVPSEVTLGSKVIIAKITEEKGQSETCSQGTDDIKRLYIDMCGSSGIAQEPSVLHEQKIILISEENKDVIGRERSDVIEGTCNFATVTGNELAYEGFKCISNETSQYNIMTRSDDLLSESDSPHVNLNLNTQPGKGFTDVKEIDVKLWDDVTESGRYKLAVEVKDLELNLTDDSLIEEDNLDNIEDGPEQSFDGPSILISEPDDEGEVLHTDKEEQELEDTHQYHNLPFTNHEKHNNKEIKTNMVTTEHINLSRVSSKVLCFIMFVVFAGLMYHYDFLVCFALYLFSLYWLYWEGDRGKNSVKKE